MDQIRFIEELDFITNKCAEVAQEYAQLRGAMNSLDGLESKFPQGASMKEPAIRFFNETKNLRVNRLVGVVWALSERAAESRKNQSSLSSDLVKKLPAPLDPHKFAGDMTLMRMRDMYQRATKLYPDILKNKAITLYPDMDERELSELVGVVCGRGRNPTLRLWPTIFSGKIDVFPGDRRSRLISSMTSVAPA
ncbi:hypothetical protein KFU81_23055 (plasmid) [Escherichia coli]|uniref:hypothetical protein n=1 Tax=Escherichia coli TaxID=562 RepID=UPI0009426DF3|nr:hypothetical protein [Escherichia coli]EEW6022337.1 hypothetical protein [Escherichia coli]EEW6022567.1 hypothetical protein [Escherichia coli]EEX2897037.1 hypothetical protein [Escherichia coli]EEX2897395.1 hypothetical protein [Escherichia coli]EFB2369049.1 hypothetical protein [Escherichia coli]